MNAPAETISEERDRTAAGLWVERLQDLEKTLLARPQVAMPLVHRFAPGVYLREIFMPAGTFVMGHEHRTEHFNIVLQGRAKVMMNGVVHDIAGPFTFTSSPGVRKVLYILEDMIWQTVHPTAETDLAKLEDELIVKSEVFTQHFEDLAALQKIVGRAVAAESGERL